MSGFNDEPENFNDEPESEGATPSDPFSMWPTPSASRDEGTASQSAPSSSSVHREQVANERLAPSRASDRMRGTHRSLRIGASAIVVTAAIVLGVGLGHLVWSTSNAPSFGGVSLPGGPNGFTDPNFTLPTPAGTGTGQGGGPANATAIARKVDPALVDINATFSYQQSSGAGTGIVLTSNGEVLTNNHVIEGATAISVTDVGNGQTYSATVVGYDATHDVAVLQLKGASGLATAVVGNSSTASVGQAVLAIGNAGGAGGTPTSAGGSISGLGQEVTASDSLSGTVEDLTGMIAVTANVQPGDSGGPLVNSSGEVLGIDTAGPSGFSIFSARTGGSAGYAIPINEAMSLATAIESGTRSGSIHIGATAFLGVLIRSSGASTGAQVTSVVAGGAAAKAGVAAGDVITSVNGTSINATSSISKALIPLHPGDTISLSWTTPTGQHVTGSATLQSGPSA